MAPQINRSGGKFAVVPASKRWSGAGVVVFVFALLGTGAASTAVVAAGNDRGNGPAIPNLPGPALNSAGHSMAPANLQVIRSVIPLSANAPAATIVAVPAASVVAVPSVTGVAVPAAPSLNAALPTASPIAFSAAAASAPAPAAGMPAVNTLNAGRGPELPPASQGRGNGTPMAIMMSLSTPPAPVDNGSAGHGGGAPVFTTGTGAVMLAAGQSVELVDPSAPDLRVHVAAPADKALDIGAIINDSRSAGIFAGLAGRHGAGGAQRAIALPDGRIVLTSARATGSGKGADRGGYLDEQVSNYHSAGSRGLDAAIPPGFRQDRTRSGNAPANGQDGGVPPVQSAGTDSSKSPARATSLTEQAATSLAGADAGDVMVRNAQAFSAREPRTCS
jgi:hypothetical protein